MRKSNGSALVAILTTVVILSMVAFGAYHRNAGAHEVRSNHPALRAYLSEIGADYRWGNYRDSHTLVIINRGTAAWTDADSACVALKERARGLEGMQLILQDGTSGTAELRWENTDEGAKVLTNMPSTDIITC